MLWENLKMALTSLENAKLRSFLTMLGIIIGVAAVTSVIAIGQGVKESVSSEVGALGTNLLQVNPGRSEGGLDPSSSFGNSTLTERDFETIASLPDVQAAAPVMLVSGVASSGTKVNQGGIIIGTTSDFARTIAVDLASGGFLEAGRDDQIVLGPEVAKELFGDGPALGQSVSIRGRSFSVVGVVRQPESNGFISRLNNENMYIPFAAAKSFNNGAAQINEIDAKVRDTGRVEAVKRQINSRLKANHGGEEDFTVLTQDEQLKFFDQILAVLTTFIALIAAISLVVGGVGIMNIMLVSVTERTREIGIRKALGATRGNILTQFLIEALTLSVLGGALGVATAYGLGLLVRRFGGISPVFTPDVIGLAVGVSAAVGIIFGIAPAIKAARKRPIQALKAE